MTEEDVIQEARMFVSKVNTTNIHESLDVYITQANAKLYFEQLDPKEGGFSVTRPNGRSAITINTLDPSQRQRFTICHEIAHIILKLPTKHDDNPSWSLAKKHQNEIFCDIFAAELLMPYKQFIQAMNKQMPTTTLLDSLSKKFNASLQSTASRFATLAGFPCAYVTMESGVILYAARSPTLKKLRGWISPRSSTPNGSIAYELRAGQVRNFSTGELPQDVWFEDWESDGDLTEMSWHHAEYDTTLSLLWFDEDSVPDFEVDRFGKKHYEEEGLEELSGELPWPGAKRRKR